MPLDHELHASQSSYGCDKTTNVGLLIPLSSTIPCLALAVHVHDKTILLGFHFSASISDYLRSSSSAVIPCSLFLTGIEADSGFRTLTYDALALPLTILSATRIAKASDDPDLQKSCKLGLCRSR